MYPTLSPRSSSRVCGLPGQYCITVSVTSYELWTINLLLYYVVFLVGCLPIHAFRSLSCPSDLASVDHCACLQTVFTYQLTSTYVYKLYLLTYTLTYVRNRLRAVNGRLGNLQGASCRRSWGTCWNRMLLAVKRQLVRTRAISLPIVYTHAWYQCQCQCQSTFF